MTLHSTTTPRRRRWPRIVAGIASGAVLVGAVAGAGFARVYDNLEGNLRQIAIDDQHGTTGPGPTRQAVVDEQGNYSAMNILLMGSDSRQGADNAGYGQADVYGGERSDTAILLHLAADRKSALAVSIPRDTWVEIPACTRRGGGTSDPRENKFNVAFETGGASCTVKLVEQLSGLTVDHVMVVDFGGFKRLIDAMGGVDVCLKNPVDDVKSHLKLPAGTSTVTGDQALAFVRARKTLGDGSDLSRIQRQQAFLSSLIRKAESTSLLSNPADLYGILDAATKSLATDPGLASLDSLRQLAQSLSGMQAKQIKFVTVPWVPKGDNANVLINDAKAQPLWDAIKNDTPWPPPPPKADPDQPVLQTAPKDIKIRVLNGSGVPGRAKAAGDLLAKAGFQVVEVGNADTSDYTKAVVLFDPSRDESAKTLSWAVTGSTTKEQANGSSTLTLIVGTADVALRPVVLTTSTPSGPAGDASDPNPTSADEATCSG